MNVLCMTGWQQPHDALGAIVPGATHFDYAAYDTLEAMFAALPRQPSLAIGWSLGGQLLVRAIAGGHICPGALWLLGAPFQWVADERFDKGVPAQTAKEVQANYHANAPAMLQGFNALIALGEPQEKAIIRALNKNVALWKHGSFWLNELAQASCAEVDFSSFPPTWVVHGMKDKVIDPANAEAYGKRLPEAELSLWEHCAHAPHLHNPKLFTERMRPYV